MSVSRVVGASAAVGLGCVAYGALIERRWFRRRSIALPGLVPTGAPLRVLHLADTHLTPPDHAMADFVRSCARTMRPDLVVATGDLLGAVGAEDATVELLEPLTADGTPGLVVLGSNDLYGPRPKSPLLYFTDPEARRFGPRLDTERFVDGLHSTGWTVLRDEHTSLEVRGLQLAVAGVNDPHLEQHVLPDAGRITAPDADDADLRLGLVHAPYVRAVELLASIGSDLVLSGHTHGGQVRLPWVGALTGNCDLPLDRVRGLSRWDDAWLHVTPGVGQSVYAPYRFGCRPEITLLELQG